MPSRFSSILAIISVLLAVLVLRTVPRHPPELTIPEYAVPVAEVLPQAAPQFRDATLDWEVVAAHQQTDKHLSAMTETLGSGVCAIDANKDGWVDLFFIGGSGHTRHYGRKSWWHMDSGNRLLLNNEGEYFSDITEQAGLESIQSGMGCAVGDLDNNGWPDLIVTGIGSTSVYSNTGDAQFVDVSEGSGIIAEQWGTGVSLADYNNDSLLDIYLTNYVAFKKGARTYERNKGFETKNVPFDATLYDPLPNRLYLNQGNFTFRDTTESAGVTDNLGRSLGAHWTDLNADGWQDLIVINDVDSPSRVYLNESGKRFTPAPPHFSLIETPESHDLLEDDFNNDGINEFLITQNGGSAPIFAVRAPAGTESYSDHAWESGIANRRSLGVVNWGATSGDFNNDGNSDLYIANGGLMPDLDSPFLTQPQHNQLILGLGNGNFQHTDTWQQTSFPLSSRAVITADLNNDGNLEIIVTNNNDPLQIFENVGESNRQWIGLDLFSANRFGQAQGARISVKAGATTVQRTARLRQGFLSSSDDRTHVGLGNNTDPVDIAIQWPDGTQSSFNQLDTGAYYVVDKSANSISPSASTVDHTERFRAAIEHYDESARTNLGRLLLQMDNRDSARQFSSLWEASNNVVRESLFTALREEWQPQYLVYLRQAIDSGAETLSIQAVDQLKSLELEYSIPWLIPLLSNKADSVSCAAAQTLQFFFEEEEAATHRKYLSVVPLIRMLESGSGKAAICAANALAAAESKRAVRPLMAQAEERPEGDVKVASIRALGLVRDNHALTLLTEIAGNPNSHSPAVVAEALIALKRLDNPNIEAYLDGIFHPEPGEQGIEALAQFEIANSLMTNNETIVFPKEHLRKNILNLLDQQSLETIAAEKNTANLKIAILAAIRSAQLTQYQFFAERLINDMHSGVREHAYTTLFALDRRSHATLLPVMLEKESSSLVLNVLSSAGRFGTAIDPAVLQQLGRRLDSYGPMAAELEPVLDALSIPSARALLSNLNSHELTESRVTTMLELCDTHSAAISSAISTEDLKNSPRLKYVYLYCSSTGDTAARIKSSHKLTNRLLLKQVVESAEYSNTEKRQLVTRAAVGDRVTAETMLLDSVQSYSGDELLHALEVLSQHQLTDRLKPFLWVRLKDSGTPLAIRLEAAKILLRTEKNAVNEYVDSEFLTHAAS